KWDPKVLPFPHFKQLVIMFLSQLLRDPVAQITGFKAIYDVQGTSPWHLKYCTPQNVYLFYHAIINCFPGRYKAIHVIHESLPMKIVWNLMKPFLSEKMRNRIYFHSNCEELLDIFPSSIIPTKYGGNLQESFDIMDFLRTASKECERYTVEGRPNIY
ncbi:Alpha-tocopherol transfer protein-like, partial [Araneus ventricosus]